MTFLAFSLALLTAAAPAQGMQMPMRQTDVAPVCPQDAEPIPAALAPWSGRTPLAAAHTTAALASAVAVPGTAIDLALADTPAIAYVLSPSHPGAPTSHGGMVAVTIATAGTYRVAIGSAAWLELVKDGVSVKSVAHGHGPNCSGIRKMVDFALQPGRYVIEVAGNDTAQIALLVAKLP